MITIPTRTCIKCNERGTVTVTTEEHEAIAPAFNQLFPWDAADIIDAALPHRNESFRQQLKNGTHAHCG